MFRAFIFTPNGPSSGVNVRDSSDGYNFESLLEAQKRVQQVVERGSYTNVNLSRPFTVLIVELEGLQVVSKYINNPTPPAWKAWVASHEGAKNDHSY